MSGDLGLSWRTLRVAAVLLLAVKLVLLAAVHPFMDEAYYWMWGQHPSLSYFDHPPLVGWTQGLSAAVFGNTAFALRVPLIVTLAGDLGLLYLFARRLAGDDWRQRFWLSATLFLSMPVFVALTGVTLPDHLLIFFALASLYALHGFFAGLRADTPRWRWLYLGAVALGFAMLAKYYAALFGIGLTLFVMLHARELLRSPHLYLAALLALAMQVPVLIWNLEHNFASFVFIIGGRRGLETLPLFLGTALYLVGIVALISPFLFWPVLNFVLDRKSGAARLAASIFWVSTLTFLAASTFTNILIHWNLVAYAVVLPFIVPYVRSRLLLVAHLIYGVVAMALFALNYAVVPIATVAGFTDQTSFWSYGWDEVAARVRTLKKEQGAEFVAATDYELAGQLGFALDDSSVTDLAVDADAFDFWLGTQPVDGQDAIIVGDKWRPVSDEIESAFQSVTLLERLTVTRFGLPVTTYRIYLGKGFSAASQAEKSTAGSGRAM